MDPVQVVALPEKNSNGSCGVCSRNGHGKSSCWRAFPDLKPLNRVRSAFELDVTGAVNTLDVHDMNEFELFDIPYPIITTDMDVCVTMNESSWLEPNARGLYVCHPCLDVKDVVETRAVPVALFRLAKLAHAMQSHLAHKLNYREK